jgi:hypothetical protein
MTTKTAPVSGLLLVAALVAGASSLADDLKLQPGSFCRAASQSQQGDLSYHNNGSVYVSGASSRSVECPIVSDQTGNTDGLAGLKAYIYVPSGTTVSCTATAMSADASTVVSDLESSSTAGNQTLDWGTDIWDSSADGTYFLRCALSNGAKIYGIKWGEWTGGT